MTFQKCHPGSNTHYTERAIIKFLTISCLHDKGGMANPPMGPDNHSPVKSLQYTSSVFFLAELQVCLVNNFECEAHKSPSNTHWTVESWWIWHQPQEKSHLDTVKLGAAGEIRHFHLMLSWSFEEHSLQSRTTLWSLDWMDK